ncbi:MAG: hypothetical protein ACRELZ_12050 [Candidatus Rokuibacteriota bacterium]
MAYTFNKNGQNVLRIGAPTLTSMANQAGVIHEAVHAIQDWIRKVIDESTTRPPHTSHSSCTSGGSRVFRRSIAAPNLGLFTHGVITQMREAIAGAGYRAGTIKTYDGI